MERIERKRVGFAILCFVMFGITIYFSVESIAFPGEDRLATLPSAFYFTIQSNIFAGLWFLWIGAAMMRGRAERIPSAVSLWVMVYIAVTAIVYWLALVPMLRFVPSCFSVSNLWMHTGSTLFAFVCFFYILRGKSVELNKAMLVVVYPLAYLALVYIVYAIYGDYVYPFFNPALVGGGWVVGSILTVTVLVVGLTLLLRRRWNGHCVVHSDVQTRTEYETDAHSANL